jgi:hypothetical protein
MPTIAAYLLFGKFHVSTRCRMVSSFLDAALPREARRIPFSFIY